MTSWFLFRTLAVSALTLAATASLYAGGGVDDHDGEAPRPVLCGSQVMGDTDPAVALANTASKRPDIYQKMLSRRQLAPSLMKRSMGDDFELEFNVWNRVTMMYDRITGVHTFEGKYVRIWLDKQVTNVTPAMILQMARALDTATPAGSRNPKQGIIQNDVDVFGEIPLNVAFQDYKVDFLLTDIKDNTVGASVQGFFYPIDQDPNNPASNGMNLLYVDTKEGLQAGLSSVLSTLAHEFQHLLHHTKNKASQTLYNEGCSEDASLLNGYQDRGNNQYMNNTNVDMFEWSDGAAVTADYERAMTFIHYLREQFGEQFLTTLLPEQTTGIRRIDETLKKLDISMDGRTALENFAVANLLRSNGDSRYGYLSPIKGGSTPRAAKTFSITSFPTDTSYSLDRLGILYLTCNNTSKLPNGIRVKFTGGNTFAVMATLYRGTSVEVRRFAPGEEYYIGDTRPYEKIVLALVNTAESQQIVTMRSSGITLGVGNDAAAGSAGLSLSSAPNPFNGPTALRFTTRVPDLVTLKIFDSQGQEVATLVDGERYESGMHEVLFDAADLPNGYYVARLSQGDRVVTSSLLLMR